MGSLTQMFVALGKEQRTTFDEDFDIADKFGVKAVRDTYVRAKKEWSMDVEYFTELVMVLNWKCYQHYYAENHELGREYAELFYKARNYALNHFKGEEFKYFVKETD